MNSAPTPIPGHFPAWTTRQIAEQRQLRITRSKVLGMLEQVTRDQGPTLARAHRDANARRFA